MLPENRVSSSLQRWPAEHCLNFALSDNSDEAFKAQCDHAHDTVCEKFEALQSVLREIEKQIRSKSIVFYNKDHQEDMLYDFAKAKNDILNWKAHILRSCNQEKAKPSKTYYRTLKHQKISL